MSLSLCVLSSTFSVEARWWRERAGEMFKNTSNVFDAVCHILYMTRDVNRPTGPAITGRHCSIITVPGDCLVYRISDSDESYGVSVLNLSSTDRHRGQRLIFRGPCTGCMPTRLLWAEHQLCPICRQSFSLTRRLVALTGTISSMLPTARLKVSWVTDKQSFLCPVGWSQGLRELHGTVCELHGTLGEIRSGLGEIRSTLGEIHSSSIQGASLHNSPPALFISLIT